MKHKVEVLALGGWIACINDKEQPILFQSVEDAQKSINETVADAKEAVEAGDLEDAQDHAEYRIVEATVKERLEYLRGEIRDGTISYDELHELQGLAPQIENGDLELQEWAGIPEEKARH